MKVLEERYYNRLDYDMVKVTFEDTGKCCGDLDDWMDVVLRGSVRDVERMDRSDFLLETNSDGEKIEMDRVVLEAEETIDLADDTANDFSLSDHN